MPWWWTFGQVPELSAPELHQVLESIDRDDASPKPLIVDVRTAAEYEGGHIKHSVNASFLPPWSFSNRVEPLLHVPKTHPIIVVCLSAHRSIGALKWLKKEGFSNVRQLAKGMHDWRERKFPELA